MNRLVSTALCLALAGAPITSAIAATPVVATTPTLTTSQLDDLSNAINNPGGGQNSLTCTILNAQYLVAVIGCVTGNPLACASMILLGIKIVADCKKKPIVPPTRPA